MTIKTAYNLSAKEIFDSVLHHHVEATLGVYSTIINIGERIAPGTEWERGLKSPDVWRPLMPPLHNFIVTAIEVYLENYFIKKYRKPDGTQYLDSEEWVNDIKAFKANVVWASKDEENQINKNFSFQRLNAVNLLYQRTFHFEIDSYSDISTIKIIFLKRHLFTHKGGIVDKKFFDSYNQFHQADPGKQLPISNIGMKATIEMDWVIDTIDDAKKFVDWISIQ